MMRIIFLLAGLVLINSCSSKSKLPAGVLKPDKMRAVLWDIIKADVFTAEFIKKDSAKNVAIENLKLQQQIFAIHKITKADFYRSYHTIHYLLKYFCMGLVVIVAPVKIYLAYFMYGKYLLLQF